MIWCWGLKPGHHMPSIAPPTALYTDPPTPTSKIGSYYTNQAGLLTLPDWSELVSASPVLELQEHATIPGFPWLSCRWLSHRYFSIRTSHFRLSNHLPSMGSLLSSVWFILMMDGISFGSTALCHCSVSKGEADSLLPISHLFHVQGEQENDRNFIKKAKGS